MNNSADTDWATIDTPFEYVRAQVNAWGVLEYAKTLPEEERQAHRDAYICRVSSDEGSARLEYSAPFEFYDPALVKMYPQLWMGDKFGNNDTGHPQFPVRLGSLDKINVSLECEEVLSEGGAERNIAFEAFFHSGLPITGPGHPSGQSNKVYELMVWFDKPAAGITPAQTSIGAVEINSVLFDVYSKKDYIAFIARDPITSIKEFDFMEFVHETNVFAMDGLADPVDADWQLSALEMGVEVWWGTGMLEITKFETDLVPFDTMTDEQPDNGIVTPVQMQSALINLMDRCAHNHILIAERNRDIAEDYASFARALRNEN